jgi:digeranylgeranylglycerophospholipid reductase
MVTIPPFDLLVVGAGPAGCSAAIAAASQGVPTLLIDAKTRIGEPSHCGEFVPARLFAEHDLDRGCLMNRVEFMETRVVSWDVSASPEQGEEPAEAGGRTLFVSDIRSSGFIIDRVRFDRDLARAAASRGVVVLCAARLIKQEQDTWIFRHNGKAWSVQPRLIIAADGAASAVASALGVRRPAFLRGIQAEAPLNQPSDRCLVFLDRGFLGGYGWVFPKKTSANVGLGTVVGRDVRPAVLLDAFLERLIAEGVIRQGKLAMSAGLIPISGIRPELVQGNVVFCGDAAGLTHPITGAGIPQAIISGTMAGHFAAESLRSGSAQPLREYQREVKAMYQGVIGHAMSKRDVMMRQWNEPDFRGTCEQSWIGFKGYRKRVRIP